MRSIVRYDYLCCWAQVNVIGMPMSPNGARQRRLDRQRRSSGANQPRGHGRERPQQSAKISSTEGG